MRLTYVSTANCDFTDPLAIHAIEMIIKDLIPSSNGDMTAPATTCTNAQCLAGMAFSNALLGIVHSFSHTRRRCVCRCSAHHPRRCKRCVLTTKVIAFNTQGQRPQKKRYGVIADYMHLEWQQRRREYSCSSIPAQHERRAEHSALHQALRPDSFPTRTALCGGLFSQGTRRLQGIADTCTVPTRQPSQEEMEKLPA